MPYVSDSITKIRVLVNDTNSSLWTDDHILRVYARVNQDFARKSGCEIRVLRVEPIARLMYAFCHDWEEAYTDAPAFCTFAESMTYIICFPWETDLSGDTPGGSLVTCGAEVQHCEPYNVIPYIMPGDFWKPLMLAFDYKMLSQKSAKWLEKEYNDWGRNVGGTVDYFAMHQGMHFRGFIPDAVPLVDGDWEEYGAVWETIEAIPEEWEEFWGDDIPFENPLIADLEDEVFYVVYEAIPKRYTTTADDIEINPPLAKYPEYGTAGILLREETEKYNKLAADHFKLRFEIGVKLARELIAKVHSDKTRRLETAGGMRGRRRPYPRMPDHYPDPFRGRRR